MNIDVTSTSTKPDKGRPPHGPDVEVIIEVNNQPVTVRGPRLTGLEIKQAAIAQGIQIQPDFVLSKLLPNGKSRIIGDDDVVTVNKNTNFRAIANDDNS